MVASVASAVLSQAGPSGTVAGARRLTHVSTIITTKPEQVSMGVNSRSEADTREMYQPTQPL
jgi:hypothetical protein